METNVGSKMRGTIIKVPGSTPGLLLAHGEQKPFVLENVWRSPVAPAANMTVDVSTDVSGVVTAVTVVDAQQLAKERFEQLSGVAQGHGKEAAKMANTGLRAMARSMGTATLIATALLWFVWFVLPAITLANPMFQKTMTFWDLIGMDMTTGQINHGVFSLLAILAIGGPFAVPFIRDSRARYLYAAPLACIVIALIAVRSEFQHVFGAVEAVLGSAASGEIGRMVSVGIGIYLLVILGVYLAIRALRGGFTKNAGPAVGLPVLLIAAALVSGGSAVKAQTMNARGDGPATGVEAQRVWSTVNQIPSAAQGNGPVLYVLAYSTCPYAAQFYLDWSNKLNNVQLRWIIYPTSEANVNATADVAFTRDPAVVAGLFERTRVSPPVRSSPARVDAYNRVSNGTQALNAVFAQFGRYHVISPTFIWRNGDRVFVSRGYEKTAFQKYVLEYIEGASSR